MKRQIFTWLMVVAALLSNAGVAATGTSETQNIFPIPETLKPNVNFWIDVYARYGSHHLIIHDAVHLDIVYEVINVDSLFSGQFISSRSKHRILYKMEREYVSILRKFRTHAPDTATLQGKEKRVYELWKDVNDKNKYRKAASNVRSQSGLRDKFAEGLQRSGRYIEEMKNIFRRSGLPQELISIAMVESLFHLRAYSKLGAAGIWQFTRSTGRKFLRINYEIDERFDPLKATEAATKLLQQNYKMLDSWPLAITAYNHGQYGMRRAKRKLKTDDIGKIVENYRSRSFGFASRNFYAEFLAAKYIMEHRIKYFGLLEGEESLHFTIFRLPDYVKLSTLLEHFGLTQDEAALYNPALRSPVLENKRCVPKGFEFRLAWDKKIDAAAIYAEIPDTQKFRKQMREKLAAGNYRVRRGDTLSRIARRAGTTTRTLMIVNGLDNPHRIYVGQMLEIPEKATLIAKADIKKTNPVTSPVVMPELLTVEQGHGTSSQPIGPVDETTVADVSEQPVVTEMMPKETLTINVSKPTNAIIRVLSDETIGHYADWLEIPTQRLRNLNGMDFGETMHIGQKIKLDVHKVNSDVFHVRRVEYHRGLREDFYQRFTIEKVHEHVVMQGDNIWTLCNERYEIPLWLAFDYNPDKDLQHLHQGDQIQIPIITSSGN